jgi:hypothetical protein
VAAAQTQRPRTTPTNIASRRVVTSAPVVLQVESVAAFKARMATTPAPAPTLFQAPWERPPRVPRLGPRWVVPVVRLAMVQFRQSTASGYAGNLDRSIQGPFRNTWRRPLDPRPIIE